jgi:hypothetical protein
MTKVTESIPTIKPTLRGLAEARYRTAKVAIAKKCNETLDDPVAPFGEDLASRSAVASDAGASGCRGAIGPDRSNLQTWSVVAVEDNR